MLAHGWSKCKGIGVTAIEWDDFKLTSKIVVEKSWNYYIFEPPKGCSFNRTAGKHKSI